MAGNKTTGPAGKWFKGKPKKFREGVIEARKKKRKGKYKRSVLSKYLQRTVDYEDIFPETTVKREGPGGLKEKELRRRALMKLEKEEKKKKK